MALKITQSATFWWPVTVMIPVDGGRHEKQTFEVEFARLGVSEADRLVASITSGERSEFEGYRDMVKGWRSVLDENGEIPFSESALRQLLEIPTLGAAILRAYMDATNGAAARKN